MSGQAAPEDARFVRGIVLAVLATALAGIVYELLLGTMASMLLGDSILEWSLTVGIFLAAMGIGSWLSGRIEEGTERALVLTQLGLALVGSTAPLVLFGLFALRPDALRFVLVLVLLALGTGVGLEIPLLTRLMSQRTSLKGALASVLAVDYLGALLASLAFPLLFYPVLGLPRTAFLAALLNLASVWLVASDVAPRMPGARRWRTVAVLGSLLFALGIAFGAPLSPLLSRALYDDPVIASHTTRYQHVVVTRDASTGAHDLFINGHLQFSSRDERRYHEALVHPALASVPTARRVLVLGGGDGLAVRELLRYPELDAVVLVDLDPEMTELSRTLPPLASLNGGSLDDRRVRVLNDDAMRFLRESDEAPFDVVIVDLPDPSTPALARLYTEEMYRMIAARLSPQGVMVTQATSPYFTRASFWCVVRSVEAAGLEARPYHVWVPTFGSWGFVLAAPRLGPVPDGPRVAAEYVAPPHWAAMFDFPPDMRAPDDAAPSSLMSPTLSSIYAMELRREGS